jgi:hypothetical protein
MQHFINFQTPDWALKVTGTFSAKNRYFALNQYESDFYQIFVKSSLVHAEYQKGVNLTNKII